MIRNLLGRARRAVLGLIGLFLLRVLTATLTGRTGPRRNTRALLSRLGERIDSARKGLRPAQAVPAAVRPRRERIAEVERVQAALLATLLQQGWLGTAGPPPAVLVTPIVTGLLDRGDALDAVAFLRGARAPFGAAHPAGLARPADAPFVTGSDVAVLRRLVTELSRRGYLGRALEAARAGAAATPNDRDRRRRALLEGEIAVLSGRFVPTLPAGPIEPIPGRILHLVGTSLPEKQSGYTLRTHYTVVAQRSIGLDPHVATQTGVAHHGDLPTTVDVDGVAYHRLAGPARGSLPLDAWLQQHTDRVAELVRALCPAVLHAASDYINALTAGVVGRACGVPVVYESRGFWEETWLSRQAQTYGWTDLDRLAAGHGLPDGYLWRRELEDRLRCGADRNVTLAAVMADRIVAGGVPRDRISVIPNGVDAEAFPVLTRDRGLAASLGIAEGTTVIGYISSVVEYEGIDTLVAAYATVKASGAWPVALLVVGDGPARAALLRQAEDLGLDDAIFTGLVPHDAVLGYYSLIDIFVVPRKPVEVCHLVTPLKPFEAFSTGRTVVLSNVRALAAIAAESGAAELFEAGSPESLAEVLHRLLGDRPRRVELAEAGAAWVRRERSWTANARAYLRLYAELGAAPRPGPDTVPPGPAAGPRPGQRSPLRAGMASASDAT